MSTYRSGFAQEMVMPGAPGGMRRQAVPAMS